MATTNVDAIFDIMREAKTEAKTTFTALHPEEYTTEQVLRWAQQAVRIWTQCIGVDCLPLTEDYHKCEGSISMRERWKQMPEAVRDQAYAIKREEIDGFFQVNFYKRPAPFAFFLTGMSYEMDEWNVRCKAVLCDKLSMSTNAAAELVFKTFGQAVKVDYIEDWKQLEFKIAYIKICSLVTLPFRAYRVETSKTHICIPDVACYVKEHDKLLYESLDELRICRETGIMHLCGRHCSLKEATPAGYFICPLTGFSSQLTAGLFEARPDTKNYTSTEQIHWQPTTTGTFFLTEKCTLLFFPKKTGPRSSRNRTSVTNITADAIVLNKGLLVTGGFSKLLAPNKSAMNDIRTKTSEIKSYKTLYVLQAVSKVQALMSEERMEKEFELRTRKINQEIATSINHLDMRISSAQKPLDLLNCFTLLCNVRLKYADIVQGKFDVDTKHRLCFRYASNVVILWWLILTRTPLGMNFSEGKIHPYSFFVKKQALSIQSCFHSTSLSLRL